jgi:hypothetical protein
VKTQLTIKSVQAEFKSLGLTLSKTVYGEFKVRLKDSPKGEGYFTDDLNDAYSTGLAMSHSHSIAQMRLLSADKR